MSRNEDQRKGDVHTLVLPARFSGQKEMRGWTAGGLNTGLLSDGALGGIELSAQRGLHHLH